MEYHNIEIGWSPFSTPWNRWRIGYSPVGAVKIAGDAKHGYTLTFAKSCQNDGAGRTGRYIGTCKTLAEVSAKLKSLRD